MYGFVWGKKTRPIHMLPPRDPLQMERYTHPKSTGTEKGMPCKWKGKTKAEVAELISNKIDFKKTRL